MGIKRKHKLSDFFFKPIEFKIVISLPIITLFVLVPFAAYADKVFIGKTSFIDYLGISLWEFSFLFIGYLFAINYLENKDKK